MYTVLLVDDEEEVIQVIMRKINWEELGFSVIGSAGNGVKALELMEEFQPDVLVTDIKMPYMDAMELAHRLKTEFPATKILLFTGFDEFEYAKEAIHLEVEEYILKPMNSAELKSVFSRLKIKLDQEISEKRSVETLEKYYLESLPLLRADFYSGLIEGRVHEDEISRYLSECQLSFPGPFFSCLVIHTSSSQEAGTIDPQLLAASVREHAKERLGKKWQAKSFAYLGNTVLILQLGDENEVWELTDECDRFCRYARRMLGAVVTVGIGQICGNILDLPRSYSSAREAVSYRAVYGASRAINIREIVPQKMDRSVSSNESELSDLFRMIRVGSEEEITEAVNRYFLHTSFTDKSLQQQYMDRMELLSMLLRFSANNGITMGENTEDMGRLYGSLLDTEPDALKNWLLKVSLSFREQLIRVRSSSTESLVSRAMEYVQNHYADEKLSLDDICASLGVSNSYFSTVFKKETGSSFVGYLTDYRLDRAARLLIETNEKSYMIASQVGYSDPNYFSYVFKKRFGTSPSKYRTEHAESEK